MGDMGPDDAQRAALSWLAEFRREHPLGRFVSRETDARLQIYVDTLLKWQTKMNLIGPSTVGLVWFRHILDSLQLLAHIPSEGVSKTFIDVGSGGGFPALAIVAGRDDLSGTLFEANQRKASFLRYTARAMGVETRVTVKAQRIEAATAFPADLITARACADLDQLIRYAIPFQGKNTLWLLLKGQDVEDELTRAAISWKLRSQIKPSVTDPNGSILILKDVVLHDSAAL
ncbi:MAG: 16S rRNA (guanine(527)-N(7))-methyltransferase RsmG [Pseudomonadota bacterium]